MSEIKYEKICKYCRKNPIDKYFYNGYYFLKKKPENNKCYYCGNELEDIILTEDEVWDIHNISEDLAFLESMIELKQKDIIEFELKMSQFRNQLNQQKQQQESNKPKCPTCGSTNLSKISTASKAGSVFMWGLLSQKVKKTWHCNSCKYEW